MEPRCWFDTDVGSARLGLAPVHPRALGDGDAPGSVSLAQGGNGPWQELTMDHTPQESFNPMGAQVGTRKDRSRSPG